MAQYWTALSILQQVAGELGLPQPTTLAGVSDTQAVQLLSLLNSSGNELMLYYPWEQFTKEWVFVTVDGQAEYDLPDDYNYFKDQTQWDRTDHWPLLGPKSPQEWAWLKGALVAALPRLRFRIANNKLLLYPTPSASGGSGLTLSMEYVQKNWVSPASGDPTTMVTQGTDVVNYNPWLMVKYVKFKFYELKGFNTTGVQGDFMRVYNSLVGKDVGNEVLSLSPQFTSPFIGPWSIPDGSWNVYG